MLPGLNRAPHGRRLGGCQLWPIVAWHRCSCTITNCSRPAAMDGEPVELAAVPASAGARLFISWGLGNELHTVDLAPSSAREDSSASVVQW